jgi:DNA (cytosine-5)-methyltransferase 1
MNPYTHVRTLLDDGISNRVGRLRGYGNSGQEEEKGVKNRVGKLRGYGNAIVPQVAAEFIKAFKRETQ